MNFNVNDIIKLKESEKNRLYIEDKLTDELCSYGVIDKVGPGEWVRIKFTSRTKRFKIGGIYKIKDIDTMDILKNSKDREIIGYGVCGYVYLEEGKAVKNNKIDDLDKSNLFNLKNYRKIDMPPPRNCDLRHTDYYIDTFPFLSGVNPWRELYILEKIKGIDGVVQIFSYSVDYTKDIINIKTEYIGKYTLNDLISKLNSEQLENIRNKIVLTVEKLRSIGVLHLDLKPKNIVLTSDLNPVIVDFGWSLSDDIEFDDDELYYYNKCYEENIDIKTLDLYLKNTSNLKNKYL